MNRRDFLSASALSALAPTCARALASAPESLRDLTITRAVAFDLPNHRSKVAGKNSHRDVHGDRATDRMLRLYTNQGVDGIGNLRVSRDDVAHILGKNLAQLFAADEHRMTGPLGPGTTALWDLAGKSLNKPVHQLLGGAGPDRVAVYDGSIYFLDLLPQFADSWQDRLRREIDMALALGHRAVKVKIGRGFKWMPRAEGDRRDVEVLRTIRAHAGDDLLIGVDANNGYDLDGARRCFDQIGELRIAFAEEMFPETVDDCLAFQAYLRDNGWDTLLADGETQSDLDVFRPFIDRKAIQVYQADMKRFGFEGILTEAAWAAPQGLQVAPHNWGSWIGYYMQLHVGHAIPNFYRAEHDPLANELLIADAYSIKDGDATLPDAPGLGITVDESRFASAKIHFDLKA